MGVLFNLGEGFFLLLDVLVIYIYDFIKHVFAQVTETFKINSLFYVVICYFFIWKAIWLVVT